MNPAAVSALEISCGVFVHLQRAAPCQAGTSPCCVWGMAKALFISRKTSNFNNRAQSQSEKEALLFSAGGRCHPAQGGDMCAPLRGRQQRWHPGAQSRRCCWRNSPAEFLRRCQCEDESDGHLGMLLLSPELQELTSGCLGKGRSSQRVLVPTGHGANWGRSSCRSGQAEGASELRRPGHINKSVLQLPFQNPFCLSLQPPSFAGSKLLASGKLR